MRKFRNKKIKKFVENQNANSVVFQNIFYRKVPPHGLRRTASRYSLLFASYVTHPFHLRIHVAFKFCLTVVP